MLTVSDRENIRQRSGFIFRRRCGVVPSACRSWPRASFGWRYGDPEQAMRVHVDMFQQYLW